MEGRTVRRRAHLGHGKIADSEGVQEEIEKNTGKIGSRNGYPVLPFCGATLATRSTTWPVACCDTTNSPGCTASTQGGGQKGSV